MRMELRSVLIGLALGAAVTALLGYGFHKFAVRDYAASRLADIEHMSAEFHAQFPPAANKNAQAVYIMYSHGAWQDGGIGGRAYHRAQAIGMLRWCTIEREQSNEATAEKVCEMAREEFALWAPNIAYPEFAKLVEPHDSTGYNLPE